MLMCIFLVGRVHSFPQVFKRVKDYKTFTRGGAIEIQIQHCGQLCNLALQFTHRLNYVTRKVPLTIIHIPDTNVVYGNFLTLFLLLSYCQPYLQSSSCLYSKRLWERSGFQILGPSKENRTWKEP